MSEGAVDCMACLTFGPVDEGMTLRLRDKDIDGLITRLNGVTHHVWSRNEWGAGWTACGVEFTRVTGGVIVECDGASYGRPL